ncbi:MAG: FecR family protein [Spirochaetia bacterium]
MKNRILIILAVMLFAAAAVGAQELVFFEGDLTISELVDAGDPFVYRSEDIYFGFRLGPNFIVETAAGSYAEIVLPNGHVLKLAENTEIQLESIVARAQAGDDRVSVARGRLRSVVAGLSGTGRSFSVQTPSAVGGVRGTDFVTQVFRNAAGAVTQEAIGVLEGVVAFAQSGGTEIAVGAGQFADALGAIFQAQAGDIAAQFYGGLAEISQQAQQVAQQIIDSLPPPEDTAAVDTPAEEEPTVAEEPIAEDTAVEEPVTAQSVQPTVVATGPGQDGDDAPADDQPSGGGPIDAFMATLTEILGLEIGTITLEGETYSKLVAQPTFDLGKLRAGLYLPVIYNGNLFDMDDWYEPKGNNEWSFGMDQDWRAEPLVALGDLVGDVALKIKFIEWGGQRDPFFLKVGSLNTLTLGHGLLMREYANDTDFPAVRRIGFNIGVDSGGFGFEALVNDLAAPEIFGARVFVRPVPKFRLAVGISAVADIGPARDLPATSDLGTAIFAEERAADPIFLNAALDLDLPIIEREAASLILYGDIGGLVPYLRTGIGSVLPGMQWNALWYDPGTGGKLRNYGIASGIFGNVSLFDYRVEFRNFRGIFEPAFYDANYDRIRGEKARDVLTYLQNPDDAAYDNSTLGVYGEAGFTIADLVRLEAGYLWPWTRDPATDAVVMGDNDYLLASLYIKEGLLPLGISAGFSYARTNFIPRLLGEGSFADVGLFDENTVLMGEIVYPVAPIMDIAASISTTILRDAFGAIQYTEASDGTLRPKYGPVINIETRIGTR